MDAALWGAAIAEAARKDVGTEEQPHGSNRGPRIDEYNRTSGSPLGSAWCASAATTWWKLAGASVPPVGAGSCETWYTWALRTGRFSPTPVLGAVVLYGVGGSPPAHHCGVVSQVLPVTLDVQGNTVPQGTFSREGYCVAEKWTDASRVIGFCHPLPTETAAPDAPSGFDQP